MLGNVYGPAVIAGDRETVWVDWDEVRIGKVTLKSRWIQYWHQIEIVPNI